MSLPDQPDPQEMMLFRYRVIAPLLHEPRGKVHAREQELARRRWQIPGTDRDQVAVSTIHGWLLDYRRGGMEALRPKRRGDHGSRSLQPKVADLLIELKKELPKLSVRLLIDEARDRGLVPDSVSLPRSTVHRLLQNEGLMNPPPDDPDQGRDRRRFAFERAGQMWQSDVLHGPRVRDPRGHARKVFLIAFLDDATRVIPHAAFAFSEKVAAFLPLLRRALERRGIPQRLYCDNGANYRSRMLEMVCARLEICLIHAKPYQPAGKGKIERWNRTVRQQLLPRLTPQDLAGLDAINARLHQWIEQEYHQTPHHGLDGDTPLDRWALHSQEVRFVGPHHDLDEIFLFEISRKVRKDRTVPFQSRLYEVDAGLIGERVTLRFDPSAPPSRPMKVFHQDRPVGIATPLDPHLNARARRRSSADPLRFRDLDPDCPRS